MKLNIPFVKQRDWDCGIAATKMAIQYFNDNTTYDDLIKLINYKSGKGLYTIELAIALAKLGYHVEFYSTSLQLPEDYKDMPFYQQRVDLTTNVDAMVKEAKKLKIKLQEKHFTLKEILQKMNKDTLIIFTVDWGVIKNRKNYNGHSVVLTGYDSNNIIVHNSMLSDPKSNLKISKELFDKARKAKGTDEDLIVIHRKTTL